MLRFDAIPESVAALLGSLTGHEALSGFALGGGTSLALRRGHRLSVDLDFFTPDEFSPDVLAEQLSLGDVTVISKSPNSLTLDIGGVKADLLRHSYPQLAPVESIDGVTLVALPDLAAMKLNAIANRGSKKDFFDLVELLKLYSLAEMLEFFSRKYTSSDPFTVIRSLAWFDEAEAEPDPVSLVGETWEVMKDRITSEVAAL